MKFCDIHNKSKPQENCTHHVIIRSHMIMTYSIEHQNYTLVDNNHQSMEHFDSDPNEPTGLTIRLHACECGMPGHAHPYVLYNMAMNHTYCTIREGILDPCGHTHIDTMFPCRRVMMLTM